MSGKRALFLTRLFLAVILFPSRVLSVTYPWWGSYDSCAWPSLDAAVPSSCSSDIGLAATQCLCESSSFLSAAAKGIGSQCGCSVLDQSAATAAGICQTYQYEIALDESQIIAAGQPCSSGTASSTSASDSNPTSNSTPISESTPTSSSTAGTSGSGGGNSGGLSPGVTAAITVISLVVAILTLLLGYCSYRKSQKNKADTKAVNDPLITNPMNNLEVQTYPVQWNPIGARHYP